MVTYIVSTILLIMYAVLTARHLQLRSKLSFTEKLNLDLQESLGSCKASYRKAQNDTDRLEYKYCKELNAKEDRIREILQTGRDDFKKEREEHAKLRREVHKIRSLHSVRFTAMMPDGVNVKTEFKQGVGPCGKTVNGLEWNEHSDRYILVQHHDDGTVKNFTYMKKDLSGRIETYWE